MITAKFGGTAMTPANLCFVKRCITPAHNCVVVSAVGREHPQDVKATDLLRRFYLTRDESLWTAFSAKYRRLAERNGVDIDVDKLLYEARARSLCSTLDYCMSLGEELSGKIAAKYLSAVYIEAEQTVRFGTRNLQYNATLKNIAASFKGVRLAVMGGFYGGNGLSRRVFSRGGSDITGSLCAVALNASLYENWTDSYGVNVANPAKVFDVATVSGLGYDQMFALAEAGAEVLHPQAVKPCKERSIPIKIGNFYNPDGASTLVSNCPSFSKVLSVVEKKNTLGDVVTTVLHSLQKHVITGLFADFFKQNSLVYQSFGKVYSSEYAAIKLFSCQGDKVTLITDKSVLVPLYKFFKSAGCID